MEIEYENSREYFISFYKAWYFNKLQKRGLTFVIFLVLIITIFSKDPFQWTGCIIALTVYTIAFCTYFYFYPLFKSIKLLDKSIKEKKDFTGKKRLTVTDEGMNSANGKKDLFRNWGEVKSITSYKKFVQISVSDGSLLIPKIYFSSEDEASVFTKLVKSKITEFKKTAPIQVSGGNIDYTIYPNGKPPYLLGFLGIIPIVGVFVGFGLMLSGIFKYKDKWLTLIGASGIFATFVIFWLMKPSDKMIQKGFSSLDTIELNSLVKEIEFYKIQNGGYPDKLKQLDTKDSFINTSDPLLAGQKNVGYNYQKIGNKYTLFSSGVDKKPNTADDIYPTIKIDPNKIGLIVKHK